MHRMPRGQMRSLELRSEAFVWLVRRDLQLQYSPWYHEKRRDLCLRFVSRWVLKASIFHPARLSMTSVSACNMQYNMHALARRRV
jgi:hypothetical protein